MGKLTDIFDGLRRIGTPTQRTALQRQDEMLADATVLNRQRKQLAGEHGQGEAFVATIEPVDETVIGLTDEELRPIAENAGLATKFIDRFQQREGGSWTLADMDKAFGAWLCAADKGGYTPEAVTEILGAAFGQYCAANLNMRWVRIWDQWGDAIAVQGRERDFRTFPFHAIAKRIPLGEHGFFGLIFSTLKDASNNDEYKRC